MGLLSFLFGNKNNDIRAYLDKGAVVLDVRTLAEYQTNHITNAKHIPVSDLKSRLKEVKNWNKPVIAHCASGMRSAQAVQLLKSNGIDAINGGGIAKMKSYLQ